MLPPRSHGSISIGRLPDHEFASDIVRLLAIVIAVASILLGAGLVKRYPEAGPAGVAIDLLACFCFWTLLWYEPTPVPRDARDSMPPLA